APISAQHLHHRDRSRAPPPSSPGDAAKAFCCRRRRGDLQVHEDDYAREPARLPAGPGARGRRTDRAHREGATLRRPHAGDQAVTRSFELIVVGSGLAGLYAALLASRYGEGLLLAYSDVACCVNAEPPIRISCGLL